MTPISLVFLGVLEYCYPMVFCGSCSEPFTMKWIACLPHGPPPKKTVDPIQRAGFVMGDFKLASGNLI